MSYSLIDPSTGKKFKNAKKFREAFPEGVVDKGLHLVHNKNYLQALAVPVEFVNRETDIQIIDFLGKSHNFEGYRLQTYREKGHTCVECGKEAKYYAIEKCWADVDAGFHVNLYCEDGTMMTVDHIFPKSKGGPNTVDNLQPMCQKCNSAKGNTVTKEARESAKEKTVEWEIARQKMIIQKAHGFIKHLSEKYGVDPDTIDIAV